MAHLLKIGMVIITLISLSVVLGVWVGYASGMPGLDTGMGGMRCPIELAVVNIRQGDGWSTSYPLDMPAFNKNLHALHGPNTWEGYPTGWNIPGYAERDGLWESEIVLYGCGHDYLLWVWKANSTPDVRYVFVFNSMKENCDKQGLHCGNHDFLYNDNQPTTFRTNVSSVMALYSQD